MTTPSPLIEALKERTDALRKHVIARGGPAKDEDGKSVGSIWPKILEAADLVDRIATETTEPDADKGNGDGLKSKVVCLRDAISELQKIYQRDPDLKKTATGRVCLKLFEAAISINDHRFDRAPPPQSPKAIRAEALEVLEWIKRHYGNGDMNHEDFRVEVYCMALKVLENTHDS